MKLSEIYDQHNDKLSVKWSSYIEKYDELFLKYKEKKVNILEIGVQNGGTLEIYSKYFKQCQNIVGVDINPKCQNLKYSDDRIKVIIGNINDDKIKDEILNLPKFDIIIDDGSHSSQDIIKTFILYYNHLNNNGLYIVEDLHCSYWKEYSGGLFFPISSISFFKKIVDVINYDHWGIKKSLDWFLKPFSHNYKIDLSHLEFDTINSVEFINSMCVLKKKNNKLGEIVKKGKISEVVPEISNMSSDDFQISKTFQESNTWSNVKILPEDELAILKDKSKNEQ
tara:strand:+ start:400 stop:1242 length:843 start_codon:yes stop_codon:yes gene_type:complete